MDGHNIQSGRGGDEKNFQSLPGLEHPIVQSVAQLLLLFPFHLLISTLYGA
jgi:hypothetical protein